MKKFKYIKGLGVALCIALVLSFSVQGTSAFITTSTNTIVNTFKPFERLVSDFVIKKTVEHPFGEDYQVPSDITFNFEVDLGSEYAGKTIKTTAGTITADSNGKLIVPVNANGFVGLQDLDEGSLIKVTEIQEDGSGFAVKDGVVTKEETTASDSEKTVEFVNVYTPSAVKPVNVSITGTKILEGRKWRSWEKYQIKLQQLNSDGEWLDLGTKTLTSSNMDFQLSNEIHNVTFDQIGEFKFRITEVVGNYAGVTYDEDAREITIKVTDNDMDGSLEIYSVNGDGDSNLTVSKDELTNTYTISTEFKNEFNPYNITGVSDVELPIKITKEVINKGSGTLGLKGFEFQLVDTANDTVMTAKTDKDGNAVFNITFEPTQVGQSFEFELSEVDAKLEGVTYDDSTYKIKVDLEINEKNQLYYIITVDGEGVTDCSFQFQNIYIGDEDISPETGDSNDIVLWISVLALSVVALIILILLYRKTRKRT